MSLKAPPTHTAPFPRPHPPFVCTGFTPTSFNICFACAIKLCHRQKWENLKGRRAGAPALPPPPPPPFPPPRTEGRQREACHASLYFFSLFIYESLKRVPLSSLPLLFSPPGGSNQRSANIKGAHGKCMYTGRLHVHDLLHALYTDKKKGQYVAFFPTLGCDELVTDF